MKIVAFSILLKIIYVWFKLKKTLKLSWKYRTVKLPKSRRLGTQR